MRRRTAEEERTLVNSTSLSMATLENMSREGEKERGGQRGGQREREDQRGVQRGRAPSPLSIQTETRISLDQFATPPRCQAKHGEGRGGWLWKRFRSQSVRMIMARRRRSAMHNPFAKKDHTAQPSLPPKSGRTENTRCTDKRSEDLWFKKPACPSVRSPDGPFHGLLLLFHSCIPASFFTLGIVAVVACNGAICIRTDGRTERSVVARPSL